MTDSHDNRGARGDRVRSGHRARPLLLGDWAMLALLVFLGVNLIGFLVLVLSGRLPG